jgi:hypothetical protein
MLKNDASSDDENHAVPVLGDRRFSFIGKNLEQTCRAFSPFM